jgi:hypothetical protein
MHEVVVTEISPPGLSKPLLVLIAGPYLSGTNGDPKKIAHNRERLESYALPIYERGHLPMVGEWMALPIIRWWAQHQRCGLPGLPIPGRPSPDGVL